MGSASSALNSVENEIAARELAKPVDGSDVAHSPTAALEEVKRLRRELRRCLDKEEFKKRKQGNKWRRGSFGQIGKAEDFWEKQERDQARGMKGGEDQKEGDGGSSSGSPEENVEEMLQKMTSDMTAVLEPTPVAKKRAIGNSNVKAEGGEDAGEGGGGGGERRAVEEKERRG